VNEYVYRIDPQPQYFEDLNRKLKRWQYHAQEEAVSALKKACKENGWKLKPDPETTEDNCMVFKNEEGVEIASVVPIPGAYWREHSA